MRNIKIVHTGDVHFDSPFHDVTHNQSKINKEELKEVFFRIVGFCKENHVDILLIAGDLFDNLTLSKETAYFIEKSLKNIINVKVFISPGNHDPYGGKSFYNIINWPSNVHIFKDQIEKVYLEDLDINVGGYGFGKQHIKKSVLEDFTIDDEKINIMVVHGDVTNNIISSDYNPITLDQIKNSKLNYLALGHKHKYEGVEKVGDTLYAYCGCPQGRGFDELGDKGIIYGEINKQVSEFKFIKMNKRNYETIQIDISNLFGYEEISEQILSSIEDKDKKNNFIKIILKGEISSEFILDEKVLQNRISEFFYYVKIVDKTTSKYDIDKLSKGYSVKAIFIKKMIKKLENEDDEQQKEIIKIALKLGIEALTDNEVNKDVYKRDNH